MKIFSNITETIGNTPLVKINRFEVLENIYLFVKLESFNPTFSIKDRIAVNMLNKAFEKGIIQEGSLIIESTSGNTGIGLASAAAARGLKLILTMPETMSVERQKILRYFGAELVLTEGARGMKGAIDKAKEILEKNDGAFMPNQFKNQDNPDIHRKTTALEIWQDLDGKVDVLVAGIGTGGTITGTAEVLKQKNPLVKIVGVEPENSAVLSGSSPGKHGIQGIGAGFKPQILNIDIIDSIFKVSDKDALQTAQMLAKKEGILCGISSGAAFYAALTEAKLEDNIGKNIVVILPDTGERYLSTALFE